jgi:Zn-finger protein
MENSSSYFSNKNCEYYPCHPCFENLPGSLFNCLFCYCPLYPLGENCGGKFEYTEKNIKTCENCMLPHVPQNYDKVLENLKKLSKITITFNEDM